MLGKWDERVKEYLSKSEDELVIKFETRIRMKWAPKKECGLVDRSSMTIASKSIKDWPDFQPAMGNQQSKAGPSKPQLKLPEIKFRVLIIGRANAGKTSILQRVCDTTDSPLVYRGTGDDREEVRGLSFLSAWQSGLTASPGSTWPDHGRWWQYSLALTSVPDSALTQRGEHTIEDEFVFSNHDGYIFHDSCGFEAGSAQELEIVQEFIQQKSGEKHLQGRLHAIWFALSRFYRRRC